MIRWRQGTVTDVVVTRSGVRELRVDVPGDGVVAALAYVEMVGDPRPGDRVLLNTAALAQQLGTGGFAMVVALPDRLPDDAPLPGHLIKARYTPTQVSVAGADEQGSAHHELLTAATSIEAMPVVVADLHSALPAVVAGILADRPTARVAYLMTDGAALVLWFSRTVDALAPLLCGTVTTGQSFGGDVEAVSVHSGLLAARHVLHADVTVVSQGPGNLGTGTSWGFSGVQAGDVVNAIGVLGGQAVGALRISDADPRERHRGVSHHSTTAFGRVALAPVDAVVPDALPAALAARVRADLTAARLRRVVHVRTDGLDAALRALPVRLSTMGRSLDEDYAYFLSAAAAGRHAASLLPPVAAPPVRQ